MKTNLKKNLILLLPACFSLFFSFFEVVEANSGLELIEEGIIKMVNEERQKEGLPILEENELLNEAAKLKAIDLLGNDYFAHTSPTGVDPWYWFDEVGYEYKYAGENLAMDFLSASSVHKAWMKSETHRENIMSPKYNEIGVAVMDGVIDQNETRIAVQMFGMQASGIENLADLIEIKNKSSIEIIEVSVSPWQAGGKDEMLAFAEIKGEPQKVEAIIGDNYYELEKLREGVYMNLIYFKKEDIEGKKIMIKATDKKENSVAQEVPNFFLDEYLAKKIEDGREKEGVALAGIKNEENNFMRGIFSSQNNLMLVVMGVFILTIFNVWFLEKEEERLLSFQIPERTNSS